MVTAAAGGGTCGFVLPELVSEAVVVVDEVAQCSRFKAQPSRIRERSLAEAFALCGAHKPQTGAGDVPCHASQWPEVGAAAVVAWPVRGYCHGVVCHHGHLFAHGTGSAIRRRKHRWGRPPSPGGLLLSLLKAPD